MTAQDKKLIRNSTAKFLIFTGQAGEQRIAVRDENVTVMLRPLPTSSKRAQA